MTKNSLRVMAWILAVVLLTMSIPDYQVLAADQKVTAIDAVEPDIASSEENSAEELQVVELATSEEITLAAASEEAAGDDETSDDDEDELDILNETMYQIKYSSGAWSYWDGENYIQFATLAGGTVTFKKVSDLTKVPAGMFSETAEDPRPQKKDITSIEFENNDTYLTVQADAFKGLTNITSVDLSTCSKLVTIYDSAFEGCTNLASITFPESIQKIGSRAFSYGALSSVNLTKNIVSVGSEAFYANKITSVTINSNITGAGSSIFGNYVDADPKNSKGDNAIASISFGSKSIVIIPKGLFDHAAFANNFTYEVPSHITEIGDGAFMGSNVSAICIETTNPLLKKIDENAFNGCEKLKTVSLNGGIETIEAGAFKGCEKLASINLPDSINEFGDNAFGGIAITSLTLPSGLTTIGSGVFKECNELTSVTVPSSSTYTIGDEMFMKCEKLKTVTFVGTISSIGKSAFSECSELKNIIFTDNPKLHVIDDNAFEKCTGLTAFNVKMFPEEATIGNGVFSGCDNLNTVYLGSGLVSIGSSAFSGAKKLATISIPDTVTSIGSAAFSECILLKRLGNKPIDTMNASDAIIDLSVYTGLNTISDSTFYACESVTKVAFPVGLTTIGNDSFLGCKSLKPLELPASLINIGSGAFKDCSALQSVTIPVNVEKIGGAAFATNSSGAGTSLTSVTINSSKITECGEEIFSSAIIGELKWNGGSVIPKNIFSYAGFASGFSWKIPDEIVTIGENAFKSVNITKYTFGQKSKLTLIESSAFANNSSLSEINLPNTLETIGEKAFSECGNLPSVTIPEGVKSIGKEAFLNDSLVVQIYYNAINVTTSNQYIFKGCNIQNIYLGEKVESIPDYLFYGATFAKEGGDETPVMLTFTVKKETKRIGDYSFTGIVNIKRVIYEEGSELEYIGESAFENCENIEENSIPNSVTTIKAKAFSGCDLLEEISVPASAIEIGDSAFKDTKIKSATIPSTVEELGASVFENCSELVSVKFMGSVSSIGNRAFYGCSKLVGGANGYFTVPSGTISIGDSALYGCSSIKKLVLPSSIESGKIGTNMLDAPGICSIETFTVEKTSYAYQWLVDNGYISGEGDPKVEYIYTIIYKLNDTPRNRAVLENAPKNFKDGEKVTLVNPTRPNYIFKGWYEDASFKKLISSTEGKTDDVTVYAKWEANKYNITYDIKVPGGINDASNPKTITFEDRITLKPATAEGYTFEGWYLVDEEGEITGNKINELKEIENDIILRAVFERECNIKYIIDLPGVKNDPKNPATIGYKDEVTLVDLSAEGYEFAGWFLVDEEGKLAATRTKVLKNIDSDITLKAVFYKVCKITYIIDMPGQELITNDNPETIIYTDVVTLKPVTVKYYTFDKWNLVTKDASGKEVLTPVTTLKNIDTDITLKAEFKFSAYNITYILDGGENSSENPLIIESEDVIELKPATKQYYDFKEWVLVETKEDGTVEEKTVSTLQNVKSDITLKAVWEAQKYTVQYDFNGGESSGIEGFSSDIQVAIEEEFTLARNDVAVRKNSETGKFTHAIVGWSTEKDGAGTKYACGQAVSKLSTEKDSTIKLYAIWAGPTYTIKYMSNGSGSKLSDEVSNIVAAATGYDVKLLGANEVSRKGYTFVEWNTKKNGKGARFNADQVTKNITSTGKSVKLYAIWSPITYTISYETDGGTLTPKAKTTYTAKKSYTLKKPKKAGYKFVGWYDNPEFTGKAIKSTKGKYENLTLYAKWQPK